MRGRIIQRKGQKNSDSWTIIVQLPSVNGKRREHWETVRGSPKEAQRRLTEILRQLDTGAYVKPDRLTVGQYLTGWIRDYVEPNTSPGTADGYRDIVRAHLIPQLGGIRLHELKAEHIQAYYADLLKSGRIQGKGGLCPKTVKNHHRVLSKALNHAVKQGRLIRNVAVAVELPRFERRRMSCLSPEDVKHFLNLAQDTPFYVLFYTAIYTGLRRGELLALRWKDIDLDFATLSVVQTLQHIPRAGYVIKEPKTRQSRRLVDLPASLAIMLREYKREQTLTFKNLWGYNVTPDDLVFCTVEGKPIPPQRRDQGFP